MYESFYLAHVLGANGFFWQRKVVIFLIIGIGQSKSLAIFSISWKIVYLVGEKIGHTQLDVLNAHVNNHSLKIKLQYCDTFDA